MALGGGGVSNWTLNTPVVGFGDTVTVAITPPPPAVAAVFGSDRRLIGGLVRQSKPLKMRLPLVS